MPKRYVCRDCGNLAREQEECSDCGEQMEKLDHPRGLEGSIPFIMAGAAGLLLLLSFVFDLYFLIWFTFPLIGTGVVYDHLYQKKVDRTLKNRINR